MYCPMCGNAAADDASYCPRCGAQLNATVSPRPPAPELVPAPAPTPAPMPTQSKKKKLGPLAVCGIVALSVLVAVAVGVGVYIFAITTSNGTMSGTWTLSSAVKTSSSSVDVGEVTATFEKGKFKASVTDLGYFGKELLGLNSVKNESLVADLLTVEGTYTEKVDGDSLICVMNISKVGDNSTALKSAGVPASAISSLENSEVTIVLPAKGWASCKPVGKWSISRSEGNGSSEFRFDLGELGNGKDNADYRFIGSLDDSIGLVPVGSVSFFGKSGSNASSSSDTYWYPHESSDNDIDITVVDADDDDMRTEFDIAHKR